MPWFKVDDNLAFHQKTIQAGNAAMGLWVRAGSWSAQSLTDGFIPNAIARQLGTKSQIDKLVTARLWTKRSDGYTFHEWDQRQPLKEDVEADRAATRKRVSEHRKRKREAQAPEASDAPTSNSVTGPTSNSVTGDECNAVSNSPHARTYPDPTRPDPYRDLPPNAAAYRPSTREPQQPQTPDTHWSDDVPIPPEPTTPPPTRGALALVPTNAPTVIDATPRPAPSKPSPTAQTLVRTTVPPAVGREIQTQLAQRVDRLRRDPHINPDDIATALTEWANRPGAGPGLLPNLVADAARAHTTTTRGAATTKAQGWLNLINELPPETKELP